MFECPCCKEIRREVINACKVQLANVEKAKKAQAEEIKTKARNGQEVK